MRATAPGIDQSARARANARDARAAEYVWIVREIVIVRLAGASDYLGALLAYLGRVWTDDVLLFTRSIQCRNGMQFATN